MGKETHTHTHTNTHKHTQHNTNTPTHAYTENCHYECLQNPTIFSKKQTALYKTLLKLFWLMLCYLNNEKLYA